MAGKTTSLTSVLLRVIGPVCLSDDVVWKPELRGEGEGSVGRRCLWRPFLREVLGRVSPASSPDEQLWLLCGQDTREA